jgi:sugar-specific transcriptional regulator TrmB
MDKNDIVEMLKSFDLSEYEAKTYSALVLLGPSKASEICKESKVPQSKIYEVISRLVDKQLVEAYSIRPMEFRAVVPEVILRNMIEEKERKVRELKGRVDTLLEFLKPRNMQTDIIDGVWTSKGKGWKDFMNRTCDMFSKSQRYIFVISKHFSWSSRLAEEVKSCMKRGVEIKTIGIGDMDESNYSRAKWFHDHGVKIRLLKADIHPSIVESDSRETLIRLDTPSGGNAFSFTSIWSNDLSLSKVIDGYLKNMWSKAKDIDFKKIKTPERILAEDHED